MARMCSEQGAAFRTEMGRSDPATTAHGVPPRMVDSGRTERYDIDPHENGGVDAAAPPGR